MPPERVVAIMAEEANLATVPERSPGARHHVDFPRHCQSVELGFGDLERDIDSNLERVEQKLKRVERRLDRRLQHEERRLRSPVRQPQVRYTSSAMHTIKTQIPLGPSRHATTVVRVVT